MPAITSNLTSFLNITRSGSLANYDWTLLSNAQTNNDTSTLVDAVPTSLRTQIGEAPIDFLQGKQLVSQVPANAISIDGLVVRIRRSGNRAFYAWDGTAGIAVTDQIIQLIHTGDDGITRAIGNNKSVGWTWDTTGGLAYTSFGGASDTWGVGGLGLTTYLVNHSGFGISISPHVKYNTSTLGPLSLNNRDVQAFLDTAPIDSYYGLDTRVDHIEFTVFYTLVSNQSIIFNGSSTIGITSGQITPNIHRLRPVARIQHIGKTSEQALSNVNRLYSVRRLNPSSISTADAVSNIHRLRAQANIRPTGKTSDQVVNNQTLQIVSYRILSSGIVNQETFGLHRLDARANIRPSGLQDTLVIGNQNLYASAKILQSSLNSQDALGQHRLSAIARINPSAVSTAQSFGNLRLYAAANILAESLRSGQVLTGNHKLTAIANIRPNSLPSTELLGNHIVSNILGIRPSGLPTAQTFGTARLRTNVNIFSNGIVSAAIASTNHYLYNYFYENLNGITNVYNYGDTSFFTWDSQYNLPYSAGGQSRSIRRLSLADGSTPGNRVLAYQTGYFRGSTFYYQGYIKINTATGLSGLGFAIDPNNTNNGYFVVLSASNSVGSPSVQIRKNINSASSASFNLPGFINTTDWYRIIITWDVNGLITAKVYKSLGSTLVATVTWTDTSYNYGYIGVAAFDDSAFDNLATIPAQFVTEVTGVTSAQIVSQSHRLIVGGINISVANRGISEPTGTFAHRLAGRFRIRHTSLLTSELIGNHRLAVNYNVFPSAVTTNQILGNHRLSIGNANIFHGSLLSTQTIGSHLLYALSKINPSGVNSGQLLGNHTLIPGGVFIYPSGQNSREIIGSHRLLLQGSQILAFTPITSAQNFGQHLLVPGGVRISHTAVTTAQLIGNHRLAANYNIYPLGQTSAQLIGSHLLYVNSNIFPNGVTSNQITGNHTLVINAATIRPSGQTTAEAIGQHRLSARYYIYPSGLTSAQNIGLHRLNVLNRIFHTSIRTAQAIGLHRLTSGGLFIFPSGKTSDQIVGNHRLSGLITINPSGTNSTNLITQLHRLSLDAYKIRPSGTITAQILGLHRLNAIKYIYAIGKDDTNAITNLHRLYALGRIYPVSVTTDQNIGLHALNSGLNIRPSGLITAQVLGLHRLSAIYKIYPDGTQSLQNTGLHRLLSRNYIYPGGLTTGQIIGSHLLTTASYIRPQGNNSAGNVGIHRLYYRTIINPSSLESGEILGLHRLRVPAYIIYAAALSSQQAIGLHRLYSQAFIRPNGTDTFERIGLHRLRPGTAYIYQASIISDQTLGLHRLDSSFKIRPTGIVTAQTIGLHRLSVGAANILASGVITNETIGLHRLWAKAWIYHQSNIDRFEVGWSGEAHGVYLSFDEFIYVNNHAPGQPGYAPFDAPPLGQPHRVKVENYNIFQSSLPDESAMGNHLLKAIASIQAISLTTEETLGLHRLNAVAYIFPSAQNTLEAIGSHRLDIVNRILPPGIVSGQAIGNNQSAKTVSTLNGSDTGDDVLLSENGTDLFTWSSSEYLSVEVILNSNILPSIAYQLIPAQGRLIFNTTELTSTDVLEVILYRFAVSDVPLLTFRSFIYVYEGIQSGERIRKHRLKLQSTPGFIDSYYLLLQTVESDIL